MRMAAHRLRLAGSPTTFMPTTVMPTITMPTIATPSVVTTPTIAMPAIVLPVVLPLATTIGNTPPAIAPSVSRNHHAGWKPDVGLSNAVSCTYHANIMQVSCNRHARVV